MINPFNWNTSLATDLYELTMAAAYFENGLDFEATFELFVRSLPPDRGYLVSCGIEEALKYLDQLHFTNDEIDYLRNHEIFSGVGVDFFDYLKQLSFTGDAWMMPEGTLFFDGEPVVRITAPVIEAQIVETYLISLINFESMIATKAARVVGASDGRPVADFGSRRAHGPEAAVRAARAAYMGGCAATSNVYAGYLYGIPITGTAAHSWIMAHASERHSFENYLKVFPENTTLLIDTYDTIEGAKLAAEIGPGIKAVRIDSGDLVESSVKVRQILDDAGMGDVKIVASGDLDEYGIKELLRKNAPIDMFGVGTKMVTSSDAPFLNTVYKLVEVVEDGKVTGKAKFSEDKSTRPFKKQVWRSLDEEQFYKCDFISMADENVPGSKPLLEKMIDSGKIIADQPSLDEKRDWVREQLELLPEPHRRIENPAPYPVKYTGQLEKETENLKKNTVP